MRPTNHPNETEYTAVVRKARNTFMEGKTVVVLQRWKYLESLVTDNGNCEEDINSLLSERITGYWNQAISKRVNGLMCKSSVGTIIVYGSGK